jgi:hypothetical protein
LALIIKIELEVRIVFWISMSTTFDIKKQKWAVSEDRNSPLYL